MSYVISDNIKEYGVSNLRISNDDHSGKIELRWQFLLTVDRVLLYLLELDEEINRGLMERVPTCVIPREAVTHNGGTYIFSNDRKGKLKIVLFSCFTEDNQEFIIFQTEGNWREVVINKIKVNYELTKKKHSLKGFFSRENKIDLKISANGYLEPNTLLLKYSEVCWPIGLVINGEKKYTKELIIPKNDEPKILLTNQDMEEYIEIEEKKNV